MNNIKILFANGKGHNPWWRSFLEMHDSENRLSFFFDQSKSSCSNADIVFSGCFGTPATRQQVIQQNPRAHKVYWSMEHSTGTFLERVKRQGRVSPWDISFTFEYDAPEYNNIRLPFWVYHATSLNSQGNHLHQIDSNYKETISNLNKCRFDHNYESRKFCTIVAARNAWQSHNRINFYRELNKRKRVDFNGNALNRIEGKKDQSWVKDKIAHQSQYRFAIAFENGSHLGYTTEKIIDAYKSGCIPIYWGNPAIVTDFNPETFINAHEFDSFENLAKYVLKVESDDNLYRSYFTKPIFSRQWLERFRDPDNKYFKYIFKNLCPML